MLFLSHTGFTGVCLTSGDSETQWCQSTPVNQDINYTVNCDSLRWIKLLAARRLRYDDQGRVHPKMKILLCCYKPVWLSLFYGTLKETLGSKLMTVTFPFMAYFSIQWQWRLTKVVILPFVLHRRIITYGNNTRNKHLVNNIPLSILSPFMACSAKHYLICLMLPKLSQLFSHFWKSLI